MSDNLSLVGFGRGRVGDMGGKYVFEDGCLANVFVGMGRRMFGIIEELGVEQLPRSGSWNWRVEKCVSTLSLPRIPFLRPS